MSSWHALTCDRPRVELGRDNAPRCRACQRHFTAPSEASSAPGEENVPVFEVPQRQSQFQWPKSVSYQYSLGLQLPSHLQPQSAPDRPLSGPRGPHSGLERENYSDLISVDAENQDATPESPKKILSNRQMVSRRHDITSLGSPPAGLVSNTETDMSRPRPLPRLTRD